MIRAGRGDGGQPAASGAAASARESADGSAAGDQAQSAATGGTATGGTATGIATADKAPGGQDADEPGRDAAASAGTTQAAGAGGRAAFRLAASRAWVRHLVLLLVYAGAGIAATWPRAAWMVQGKLPATSDVSGFVWNIWWSAHQLLHAGNPFFTNYMAAPVGTHLAFSTLMPLAGWAMSPVTVLFGPSASFALLTIIAPGLLCYTMYRAARLWLNEAGSIVAGAFFGLSSMMLWQDWYHVNIALGTIFVPIALEAAIRFRRDPRTAPAVGLGLAIGATILLNQESTAIAVIITACILIPWLVMAAIRNRRLLVRAVKPLSIGAAVGLVAASPELVAMLQQLIAGAANPPIGQLSANYAQFGVPLPTLFAPSPRLANFGLGHLASAYSYYNNDERLEGLPTFGVVLSGLAVIGALIGLIKRKTRVFAGSFLALWVVCAALALGTSLVIGSACVISTGKYHKPGKIYGRFCHQYLPLMSTMPKTRTYPPGGPVNGLWQHVLVSNLMPYTWLVRIPGLSGLREADRFALIGLIGAAMLAGLTVQWLSRRKITMPLIAVVVALGALEAGWSGAPATSPGYHGVMSTSFYKLDRFLIGDHSHSIVVDVPYGLRGGVDFTGAQISPQALLMATHDQHPRAISYTAWVSQAAIAGVARHAFYRYLYIAEKGQDPGARQIRLARADLRTMNVGWVVMWRNMWTLYHPVLRWGHVDRYLIAVGFRHTTGACLITVKPGAACPEPDAVWLYQYQPGHHGAGG